MSKTFYALGLLLALSISSPGCKVTAFTDTDNDGLSDEWELSAEGQALGAKVGRKDVFFQFDWFYCTTGNNFDPKNVLENEFNTNNRPRFGRDEAKFVIGLYRDRLDDSWCAHIDNGETIWDCDDLSTNGQTLTFNEARKPLAKARSIGPIPTAKNSPTLTINEMDLFNFFFPPERAKKFHYALIGCYGGGQASFNDVVVQVGNNGKALAHEFGHKFGLGHGGGDRVNRKPNYPSIMNYSVAYSQEGYSRSKYPTLNEFDVCEEKGLGIALSGEKVTISDWAIGKSFEIPKELSYLTEGGIPPRSIGPNGAIDWNGDGVISPCDSSLKESNLEFAFGDFPLVRDSVVKTTPFITPQLIEVQNLLAMVYVAKDTGDLSFAYGPDESNVAAIREKLAAGEAAIEGVSVFNGKNFKLDYDQTQYGKVSSGLSVARSVVSDFVGVFVTDLGYLLEIEFSVGTDTMKTASVRVLRAPNSLTPAICDPVAAADPALNLYAIVGRICSNGELVAIDPITGATKSLGESADYGVATGFDLKGDFYVFGSRHPSTQIPHPFCGESVSALFSHRYDSQLKSLEAPQWIGKDHGMCPYTLGETGAIFDPSPLRSLAGRFYVFLRGGSEGMKRDLWTYHFDIAAQSQELMSTQLAHVGSPLFAWDPPVDQCGAGRVATGIYFKGRTVMIAPTDSEKNEGQKSKHGAVLFSPSADAINRTKIEGNNDMISLLARLPVSIREMPSVDLKVRQRTPGDRDGDGTPDALDNCPDHYNRPTQKNAAGELIGDQEGLLCK
ncbi:hypothetical protein WDW86_01325 [Bdellovibrionota bacterium FG-2]